MKMMCKVCILTGLLAMFFALGANRAHAEFTFFCGEGRDKGLESAEISFVDSIESSMKLYLDGKEVSEDKLGFKAANGGVWIVSIDNGPGKGSRKLEFKQEKQANLEEFAVDEKGAVKKSGARRKCDFEQKL